MGLSSKLDHDSPGRRGALGGNKNKRKKGDRKKRITDILLLSMRTLSVGQTINKASTPCTVRRLRWGLLEDTGEEKSLKKRRKPSLGRSEPDLLLDTGMIPRTKSGCPEIV